ncbi:5-formyltetrahydrofolate cyclo-ligase [Actinospica robiniae]|uniref:5-formyltetrahydrofolate cyclo-ligase n=1 Tax=Actinospica robiniae TaxID=304901 RepID=UPI0003FE4F17|nr:5-formyltetrahydrofolate cyclo-ligase [Actinospica robiniae]
MPDPADDKATARSRFVNNRRDLDYAERTRQSRAACARLLDTPRLSSADTVAAYWPLGTEPDTRPLLDALLARGTRLLLPVLLDDRDLDWALYVGADTEFVAGGAGTSHPASLVLGVTAVLQADVLIVPALAVTDQGVRLGRGGGSYDRVLERIGHARTVQPWACALLYEHELGTLPPSAVEAHDEPVDAACTATHLAEFGPASRPQDATRGRRG